jgi:hypothetical protein
VTGEREPTVVGTGQESLSLAERLARAYYDWLHDKQRHREKRFEPIEMVLFSVTAGVTLIIVGEVLGAVANVGSQDAWTLVGITSQWAQPPIAFVLLGASLLGWYQSTRSCDEFETYLDQDEQDQDKPDGKLAAEVDQTTTWLLRRLNRSRLALACIAVLGLVTIAAAIAAAVWQFHALPFPNRMPWYWYVGYVAVCLAVVIPALACVMIAARAWARTSYLLLADETDEAFEDEPEQPAEPESVS